TGKVSVHSWPVNGVLHGNITGDEYYVDYRWNQLKSPDENGEWHAAIPQRLRHNGKLVFEAHWVFHFTIDENGAYVKETIIEKINCK
nr:hypothetical protein [Bacteroidales bacterium]